MGKLLTLLKASHPLSHSFPVPPPFPVTSRGTLNMAPCRRATERAGQLEAPVARGRCPSSPCSPTPLAGWVGGWVAYGGQVRNPSGVTHRRPGATQAGPAIAVGDSVSPSLRGGPGLMFEIPPRKHPKLNPLLPLNPFSPHPENASLPPLHRCGDSAVVSTVVSTLQN